MKPPCKHDFFSICYEYYDCAAPGNHDSYPDKVLFPALTSFPTPSPKSEEPVEGKPAPPAEGEPAPPAEGKPAPPAEGEPAPPAEGEPAPPAEGKPAPPAEGEPVPPVFDEPVNSPTFAPFSFGLDLTPSPTFEPTTKHNCDPEAPPCKAWTLGVCTKYEKCFGVHTTPVNASFDDDEGYTFAPTPMPLPNPTPMPTNPPTSVPSTSAPTYVGYTPSPTVSMKPTAAETFGPTQTYLCDPQKPPCDHYFFGVCLGIRHCDGSHEPTPAPTPIPSLSPVADLSVEPTVASIVEETGNVTITEAPEESTEAEEVKSEDEKPAWKVALEKKMAEKAAAKAASKATTERRF